MASPFLPQSSVRFAQASLMDMMLWRPLADDAIELVEDRSLRLVRREGAASVDWIMSKGDAGNEAGAGLLLSFAGVWIAAELRSQIWDRVGGVECGVGFAAELRAPSSLSTEISCDPGMMGGKAVFFETLVGLRERGGSASEA